RLQGDWSSDVCSSDLVAERWQEQLTRLTSELAEQYLSELAELERQHGMRLRTVADRLQERFVKPLALDRLCALIEPVMEEVRTRSEERRVGKECRRRW